MKKKLWKRGLAAALALALSIQGAMVAADPVHKVYAYTERTATINASTLNVRSGAGTGFSSVAKLSQGSAVVVIGETTGSDGKLWYQIRFTGSGGSTVTGYVLGTYVQFPVAYSYDGNFEAQLNAQGFPESYKDGLRQLHAQYPNWTFTAQNTGLDWNTVIENESVLGRNLVYTGSISSFKSTADGAYNWDTGVWTGFDGATWVAASQDILRYYMDPRNFLNEVYIFQFMSQAYDPASHTREGLQSMLSGTFMEGNIRYSGSASGAVSGSTDNSDNSGSSGTASSGTVTVGGGPGVSGSSSGGSSTTTTPTPGTTSQGTTSEPASGTESVPEVRLQGPQASISKKDAAMVGSSTVVIAGPGASSGSSTSQTPGASASPEGTAEPQTSTSSTTYLDAIMNAAESSGVSPYVIAAMIIQEQGSDGRGNSISGNYGGYTGYYNYFNVGAYASDGMSAVVRGLWYASQSGTYGRPWTTPESAISGGAEFYGLNYVKAGQDTLYLKKYNVQGSNMYKHQYMTNVDGAASEGSLFAEGFTATQKNAALNFRIPVYSNMPETPCARPAVDGSPNNKLSGLGVEGFTLTPTFGRDTVSYDLIVDHSVGNVTIQATAIDSKATVSGIGNIQLQSGDNDISVVVRAENGDERTYTIHVVRQTNGPTYNAGLGGSTGSSGTTAGGSTDTTVIGPGGSVSSQGPGSSAGGTGTGTSETPGGAAVTSPTPGGSNVVIVSPAG